MRITVRVTPGATRPGVEKNASDVYAVRVSARAKEGEANEAVVRSIAKHFKVAPSSVKIVRGLKGRNKILEIEE
jgi:hypothetical protein